MGSRNSTYHFQQHILKTRSRNKNQKKKSKIDNLYKNSDLYYWNREVRIAYGYRCVICNTNRRLSAHHIFAKSKYPGLKFNIGNGILLCKNCHLELHQLNDIAIKH